MASPAPLAVAAPSYSRIMQLAAVLLIMILKMDQATSHDLPSASSAVQYWKKILPNVPLPAQLRQRVSPLDSFTELITHYKDTISAGRVVQPAAICMAARLYCDAKQFEEFRLVHPSSCGIKVQFRNPTSAHDRQYSQGNFFRESDLLQVSHDLVLRDQKLAVPTLSFLPRQLAQLFQPLTAQLLQQAFSIPSSSLLAKESMHTSHLCSRHAKELLPGEEAFCALSLEDLADHLKAKVLDVSHSGSSLKLLPISSGAAASVTAKLLKVELQAEAAQPYLSCHPQTSPFALHLCHHIPNTRIYSATFKSTRAEVIHAVAVCHMDTSDWSPLHVAFADLHSTPGHTEACHWTHENSLIFVPTK